MDYLTYTKQDMELQKSLREIYREQLSQLRPAMLKRNKPSDSHNYSRYQIRRLGEKDYSYIGIVDKAGQQEVLEAQMARFYEKTISIMEENIKIQEKVLRKYRRWDHRSVTAHLPEAYQGAPKEWGAMEEEELVAPDEEWVLENTCRNDGFQSELRFPTPFGFRVRSKSELFIATALYRAGIYPRYEPRFRYPGADKQWRTCYPDFEIRIDGNRSILWEHCGLFGEKAYREDMFEKIAGYFAQGYELGHNLIVTCDDANGVLDSMMIERIVQGIVVPMRKGSYGVLVGV